ncbi:GNAT family N-acetyltransferase [Myxococcota bacterium]|nr:GNAT family N-acetyltransferase [Myxococcota bacterium]
MAIRPVELSDAEGLCDALVESREALIRWFFTPDSVDEATPTREQERARIASQIRARETRTAFSFVVVDVRDRAILGGCTINYIAWQPGFANVGYWVRTSRHGQGIAPEAVRQLARFGLEQLGLHRLELVIDVDNRASIRVAEKAGAVFEGILRNRVGHNQGPRPARMYSIVSGDLGGRGAEAG